MAGTDLTMAKKRAFRSWLQSYFAIELVLATWPHVLAENLHIAATWRDLDERTLALAGAR